MVSNYKVSKSEYFLNPYPHIVKDNIFSDDILNSIKNYWPDDNLFNNEIEGIRLLDLHHSLRSEDKFFDKVINALKRKKKLTSESLNFWENFVKNDINKINLEIFKIFKKILFAKFSTSNTPNIQFLNLMHASNKFIEHHVHNHHYHNPNWTFTILIYVDKDGVETPGTDVYEIKQPNNKRSLEFMTNFSIINPILTANSVKINKYKTIDFKQNRLFAFLDSPISYHGVKKTKLSKKFNKSSRKIVRLHCSYDDDIVKKLYKMNIEEYKKIRKIKNPKILTKKDNNVYKGVKYELENLFSSE
ncbi:hypothetical protein OA517_01465 [Alphaproteobacteria bacterium]|nr:hypothetical protein [Alphaproteobacteria bacterium]